MSEIDIEAKLEELNTVLETAVTQLETAKTEITSLVAKANKLVELMDQAETQHGGLIGSVTLRAKNELRLELSKWR